MSRGGEMDERQVRLQLDETKELIRRNEEEHEVLETLIKGLEGWLRLHGAVQNGKSSPQLTLTVDANGNVGSWRKVCGGIVKDARGEAIHSKEVWARAQAIGLRTKGKFPVSAVDLTLRAMEQIEKVGPRLWRWKGD